MTRSASAILIAPAFLMIFCFCDPGEAPEPRTNFDISGYVLEEDSVTVIPGVLVTNYGSNWMLDTTDSDGHFTLRNVPWYSRSMMIEATKDGYERWYREINPAGYRGSLLYIYMAREDTTGY
jgi:hypothetical protein